MTLKKIKLNDNEIKNVRGGSFFDKNHTWSSNYPYYLIVFSIYSCNNHEGNGAICATCKYAQRNGLILYCTHRTYNNDPMDRYMSHSYHKTTGTVIRRANIVFNDKSS